MSESFIQHSNFTKVGNFSEVTFGSEKPVLETELNELQHIQNYAREQFITDYVGDGLINDLEIKVSSGKFVTSNDTTIYAMGKRFFIPKDVSFYQPDLTQTGTFLVYLEFWQNEITGESGDIHNYGNYTEGATGYYPNLIIDDRYGFETTRRMVNKWALRVCTGTDITKAVVKGDSKLPKNNFEELTDTIYVGSNNNGTSYDGYTYALPLFEVTTGDNTFTAKKVYSLISNSALKNLEIGGRNYCEGLGGNYYDKKFIYSDSRQYATIETIDNKTWVKFTGNPHYVLRNITIEPNTTYTWSFYAYADRDCRLITRQKDANSTYNRQEYYITTTPQKIVTTFITRNDSTQEIFHLYATSSEVVYYCSDFKLEKGNVATDYTYSEDYMKTTVDGLVTKVDTNTSEINNMKESIIQNKPIVINDDSPVGTIAYRTKGQTLPSNWLYCDGSTISKTTYPELFAVIGYTYGGSGDSFKLPKLVLGNNLLVESSDSTNNHYVSEVLEQQGIIKVKSTSQDMKTVAQEWTSFKDNGGDIGGTLTIADTGIVKTKCVQSTDKFLRLLTDDETGIHVDTNNPRVIPTTSNAFDLGSDSYRWKDLYINSVRETNGLIYSSGDAFSIQANDNKSIMQVITSGNNSTTASTLFYIENGEVNFRPVSASSKQINLGTSQYRWKDVYAGELSKSEVTGYTTLTNGMILQWTEVEMTATQTFTKVTLPITFPNGFVGTWCNCEWNITSNTNAGINAVISNVIPYSDKKSVQICANNGGTDIKYNFKIFALGY